MPYTVVNLGVACPLVAALKTTSKLYHLPYLTLLVQYHGWCMAACFAFVLPIGIVIATGFKNSGIGGKWWPWLHGGWQVGCLVLSVLHGNRWLLSGMRSSYYNIMPGERLYGGHVLERHARAVFFTMQLEGSVAFYWVHHRCLRANELWLPVRMSHEMQLQQWDVCEMRSRSLLCRGSDCQCTSTC